MKLGRSLTYRTIRAERYTIPGPRRIYQNFLFLIELDFSFSASLLDLLGTFPSLDFGASDVDVFDFSPLEALLLGCTRVEVGLAEDVPFLDRSVLPGSGRKSHGRAELGSFLVMDF